jgi:hypothetical protein
VAYAVEQLLPCGQWPGGHPVAAQRASILGNDAPVQAGGLHLRPAVGEPCCRGIVTLSGEQVNGHDRGSSGPGPAPAPAVIYCHSGAFVLGNLDTDHRQCVEFARRGRCTVISVDYRLAPEDPYPAGLDDAAAVLAWAADNGANLGIDITRLVLDDRPMPSKDEFVTTPGLDGPAVTQMWQHYFAGEPVPADAVPARAAELAGVASTLITCSELDRSATRRLTTHCGSCGPAWPPSCMSSPAPATASTRCCRSGKPVSSCSSYRARR